MNNLPDSILNSKVAMFVGDAKVYKEVKSEDDGATLQQDLDNVSMVRCLWPSLQW